MLKEVVQNAVHKLGVVANHMIHISGDGNTPPELWTLDHNSEALPLTKQQQNTIHLKMRNPLIRLECGTNHSIVVKEMPIDHHCRRQ